MPQTHWTTRSGLGRRGGANHTHLEVANPTPSSVFSLEGAALREDGCAADWEEPSASAVEGAMGSGRGSGFTVKLERALSVLELVTELRRELASFWAIVAGRAGGDGRTRANSHATASLHQGMDIGLQELAS